MKLEKFIENWQKTVEVNSEIDKIGLNIHEVVLDNYWGVINPLLDEIFSVEQIQRIESFIYNEEIGIEELHKQIFE